MFVIWRGKKEYILEKRTRFIRTYIKLSTLSRTSLNSLLRILFFACNVYPSKMNNDVPPSTRYSKILNIGSYETMVGRVILTVKDRNETFCTHDVGRVPIGQIKFRKCWWSCCLRELRECDSTYRTRTERNLRRDLHSDPCRLARMRLQTEQNYGLMNTRAQM